MAIYHLSIKTISRSSGRTATAAAAYRAGVEITDERTGEVHDYTRKAGVSSTDIVLPPGAPDWAADRAALWNAAEQSEKRKNSTVAREFEIALPAELSADQRRELAVTFAREISERHKCAVDVAIHLPGKEGDNRNHHAHILTTTRRLGPDGFGEKCRELDDQKSGEVQYWRQRWGELVNVSLERAGEDQKVDHRSHKERGLDPATATIHMGPVASAIERKGRSSERGQRNQVIRKVRQELATAQTEHAAVVSQIEQELKPEKVVDVSVAEQVKAISLALDQTAAKRREKAARVAVKVDARYERRRVAMVTLRSEQPKEPTGLLAAFKERAHGEAMAIWEKSYARAQKLMSQADELRSRVHQAVEKATTWASDKLRKSNPADMRLLADQKQAERRQVLERQQKERDARRALQKGLGRGRS